ncbi:MAG TPA: slipin family protein [Flavisolibacter sp.]|nr:slipin family protein [Flavisolibacter sp.]
MRKVRINKDEAGLVFEHGQYKRFLNEGVYWLWPASKVHVYNRAFGFPAPAAMSHMLQDARLAGEIYLVEAGATEIVLVYADGLLREVVSAGRYIFWKGLIRYEFVRADIGKIDITEPVEKALLEGPVLAPYVRKVIVESYEKALLFVDGSFAGPLGPGTHYWWKNNIPVHVSRVDTRQLQAEINGQEILTRDKAALRVNAFANYLVVDAEKAVLRNKDYERQLYTNFQLALRENIGMLTLDELLERKETMGPLILRAVNERAKDLGVEVLGFGIRDIILPGDVREIMNSVLVAEKKAQANSIARREETASTRSLLNTAKLMEDNQMLWKLKEMEYVEKIAEKISSISVSGNGVLIDQLRQIFVPPR